MNCKCGIRGFVRSLEEDEIGLTTHVQPLTSTAKALLGRCAICGAWWERLPHEVYGYAWFRTQQRYWDAGDTVRAASAWSVSRQAEGL